MAQPFVLDFDLLARRCQATGRRATARELLDLFEQIDWDAQTDLLQRETCSAEGPAPDEVERLRAVGWRVEEHPRFTGREFVFQAFEAFAGERAGRGGVFLIRAPAGMGKTALV